MILDKLEINCTGIVKSINCTGNTKRRLLDLGLINGTAIKPVLISPLGDPRAYEIRSTLIALRSDDAEKIEIM